MNRARSGTLALCAALLLFYVYVLTLAVRPQVSPIYRLYYIEKNLRQWKHGKGPEYQLGDAMDFRQTLPYLSRRGWSVPEPWGTWTDGRSSEIHVHIGGKVAPRWVVMEVNPYIVHEKGVVSQTVTVYANDHLLGSSTVNAAQLLKFEIPPTALQSADGLLRLRFEHANPAVPHDLGLSSDRRVLALGFLRLTVQ